MSNRPDSQVGTETVRPPSATPGVPDSARPPGRPPLPDTPTSHVPNALLDRPHADHLPVAREDYRSASPRPTEAARRALALLAADPDALPAFHLPAANSRHPVVVAAAACPDVFLLDAPAGPVRVLVTADIAEQCAVAKQRVLVLAPDAAFANEVTERLARRGEVIRRLARGETADRLPAAVAARTEAALAEKDAADRRARLEQRIADRTSAIASIDELRQAADRLHPDEVAAVVERSEGYRELHAAHAVRLAALAADEAAELGTRTTLETELGELKTELAKPAGLFKRLLGGAKPDPVKCERTLAIEGKLAEIAAAAAARATARAEADSDHLRSRDRLIAEETARRQDEHTRQAERHQATLTRLGFDDRPDLRDHLAAELADATAELATVNDLPPMLSADARARLLVTVAVFDPQVNDQGYDRVVFAAAEALSEEDVLTASAAGRAWVLIGQSGPLVSGRSNRHPSPYFRALWNAAHRGPWTPDFFAPTVRLAAVPLERQPTTTSEPLADWPDVELRLFDGVGGDPVLAEVRFPARTPLADIRRFLADELGEIRLNPAGPARWHVTADQLMCCWPACESAGGRAEWVTLPGGVKERVTDAGPAGLTAAVSFDPAKWTRAAAEEWVTRHARATARTAVLPR